MFTTPTWWYLHLYGWKDILEITLFSGALYYFSLWLQRDKQKPLLLYFYGYCLALTVCYVAHLATTQTALLLFSPVILVVFVVLHQESLQRNFVALHTISSSYKDSEDWVSLLMRSCLVAVSNHKELSCVIERRNALQTLLDTPFLFQCKLKEGLLDFLTESDSFNDKELIWLQDDGTLLGVNCSWKKRSIDAWLAKEVKEQEPWLQDALFFTSKVDALYFKINATTRTFTLVAQGKVLEKVSAHAAVRAIKKYLGHFKPAKKGDTYATSPQTVSSEQSLS